MKHDPVTWGQAFDALGHAVEALDNYVKIVQDGEPYDRRQFCLILHEVLKDAAHCMSGPILRDVLQTAATTLEVDSRPAQAMPR